MSYYRIADLTLTFQAADVDFFDRRMAAYAAPRTEAPSMTMVSMLVPSLSIPQGMCIASSPTVQVIRLPDGRLCKLRLTGDGRVPLMQRFTPDYFQVELLQAEDCCSKRLSRTDLEYMYTGSAFGCRLGCMGGGVLHSSAIAYKGRGIAFTADSGVGKSTHTGLWLRHCPADAVMLNDDKPAIRFEGDEPFLYGTPWSGKTAQNANMRVPLHAIVCLHRGSKNTIRRLEPLEALYWVTRQVSRPFYDRELCVKAVDFTRRLVELVPVYELHCTMEPAAVDTVRKALFGG